MTAYVEYPNGATGVFISTTGEFPGTNRFEIVLDRATILCENGKLSVFELEDSQQHFIDTCPEASAGWMEALSILKQMVKIPQPRWRAACLRGGYPARRAAHCARQEGINGLTLSNANVPLLLAK